MVSEQHRIPPPSDTDKEVQKANVYERAIAMNSQLAPLFRFVGPGDIVVTVVMQRGHVDKQHGLFYHTNTQEEVTLVLAANGARIPLGTLMCSSRFHGVTTMFVDDHDPDAYMLMLIIQRQEEVATAAEQQEGFGINCSSCQEPLLRAEFNANPTTPEKHGTNPGDLFPMFSTIWGCYDAAKRYNEDESMRTCEKCGHLNDSFPHETWGWADWVAQNRAANSAVAAMTAAANQTSGAA